MIEEVVKVLEMSKPKEQWTECCFFRCVFNTGWAAGEDKYKCRHGLNVDMCGAVPKPPKNTANSKKQERKTPQRDEYVEPTLF